MTLVMLQSPLCFCLKMPLFLQEPFLQPCRSSLRLQPHPSLCHHLPTLYSGQPLLFLQWSLPGLGTSCSQGPSRLSPLLSYSAGPSQPSTASSPSLPQHLAMSFYSVSMNLMTLDSLYMQNHTVFFLL